MWHFNVDHFFWIQKRKIYMYLKINFTGQPPSTSWHVAGWVIIAQEWINLSGPRYVYMYKLRDCGTVQAVLVSHCCVIRNCHLSMFSKWNGEFPALKALLHRGSLSRQLNAVFVAEILHQVSYMFETSMILRRQIALKITPGLQVWFSSYNQSSMTKIASSCCNKNRLCKQASRLPPWN